MAKEMMMHGDWGMHKKWMGAKILVLGAFVLCNIYWSVFTWPAFIGVVLVLAGICWLIVPCCGHRKR